MKLAELNTLIDKKYIKSNQNVVQLKKEIKPEIRAVFKLVYEKGLLMHYPPHEFIKYNIKDDNAFRQFQDIQFRIVEEIGLLSKNIRLSDTLAQQINIGNLYCYLRLIVLKFDNVTQLERIITINSETYEDEDYEDMEVLDILIQLCDNSSLDVLLGGYDNTGDDFFECLNGLATSLNLDFNKCVEAAYNML